MSQQLHRNSEIKAVTQSSLPLINLGGKRLLKSTFGVNIIKTTLWNTSKQDERGAVVKPNSAVKREVRWEPNPVGPAGALPSTREATVWSPGPRGSCISWRVFFSLLMQEWQVFFKEWGWILQKKKKGFLLGPVWLASAAIVRYLQSEWAPAHLYLIQLCLLLSLRKRLLDRGILLLSYVDNLYKSRWFSLSTGSP